MAELRPTKKLYLKSILKEIKEIKIVKMAQGHCSTEMVDLCTIVQEQKCLLNNSLLYLK